MIFLTPAMLWGLLAASIPIIIHLYSLRQTKEIEFSSLKYIRELEYETIKRLKIRQWLLVLLRMLIIICLILMAARPVFKGFIPAWIAGIKESRVVVILDNSASMSMLRDGRSLLENGKSHVLDIADIYDELTVFHCYQTNPLKQIYYGSPGDQSLKTALERVQFSNTEDHLFLKVDSVLHMQDAFEPNKECFIISDFSKQIHADMVDYIPVSHFLADTSETGWRFYGISQEELTNNLSLLDVDILSQIRLPNSLLKIETTVKNDGLKDKRNIPLELFLKDDRLGQVVASFSRKQRKDFIYQVYPGMSGVIQGHLEIPEDDYLLDNYLSFDFTVPEQISCTVMGRSVEETFLLETALSAIDNQTGFLLVETKINPNPDHLPLDYTDVLIMYNPGRLSPNVIDDIQIFLNGGGGIIWFAGDRTVTQLDEIGAKSLQLPQVIGLNSVSGESFYSVSVAENNHPVLDDLKLRKIENELPQVFQYIKITPPLNHIPVFTLNNGDPYLLEIPIFGGILFYFTSLMDLNWSDFPIKGLAVSLLHRILLYLATDESNTKPVIVGEIKMIGVEDKDLKSEWTLLTPSGKKVQLIPDYNANQLKIMHTEELGSYKVLNNGETYASFSTVLSEFEYPSERLSKDEVLNLFSHDRVRWVPPQTDLENHLKNIRYGSSLWRGFLILAIIFFLLETILGTSRIRR